MDEKNRRWAVRTLAASFRGISVVGKWEEYAEFSSNQETSDGLHRTNMYFIKKHTRSDLVSNQTFYRALMENSEILGQHLKRSAEFAQHLDFRHNLVEY